MLKNEVPVGKSHSVCVLIVVVDVVTGDAIMVVMFVLVVMITS